MSRFKHAAAAMVIALSACGGGSIDAPAPAGEPTNNHGYGYEFDAQGAGGLRLRFKPFIADNGNIFTKPAFYEQKFAELLSCTGLDAPMPPFLILEERHTAFSGVTHYNPVLILADYRSVTHTSPDVVKHEMLHYVLFYATGDADIDHLSPLFARCAFL